MAKSGKLKVYGWESFRGDAHGRSQTREIVAAHSVTEVLQLTGSTRYEFNNSGCETANDEEMRVALAQPGVVFWTELSSSHRGGANWHADRDSL